MSLEHDLEKMLASFAGRIPTDEEARQLGAVENTRMLMSHAARIRDEGHGDVVTYSRKVFIPLTQLCRDVCHYCTFAHPPLREEAPFLSAGQVLAIAEAGRKAGCKEALFTLGDKPELRYRVAKEFLDRAGYASTLDYLRAMAKLVLSETGLLPHLNPGVMSRDEILSLRDVSASMGIILESASERLCQRGHAHFGSPDKHPAVRLQTIEAAGEAAVPFTSGILIGIGETRAERIESLLVLRRSHQRHGHLQEVIIQNFRAKPGTRMADAPEPSFDEHLCTIAVARIILGPQMSVQAPPNRTAGEKAQVIAAGINDWGGVSPVTMDYVNPEAPWPHIQDLARDTAHSGKHLAERLTAYPSFVHDRGRWFSDALRRPVLEMSDADGLARTGEWRPGAALAPDHIDASCPLSHVSTPARGELRRAVGKARDGKRLNEGEIVALFGARGEDFEYVRAAADGLRQETHGDAVSYVVTRNINYTNVCYFRCQFCAFSKGKMSENLRGKPYDLELGEIARRVEEAWSRGATEVCLQGGIHPSYTGATYLEILETVKKAVPEMHVHAFSPLEVWQGASTLGMRLEDYLRALKDAGLGSLPGTAAEILDDEVRQIICPDKIDTQQWLEVMRTAHGVGLRSTATIMFGHVDRPHHWARHLLRIRDLQAATGGFTEFVPLPFVPMETPIYLKGRSRQGPTFREAVLMHAVGRLVLHPLVASIQASWVKMGLEGLQYCLDAGVNDLGGTLMNETISRAAGASHGQEMRPSTFEEIAARKGRSIWQRTTLYKPAPSHRRDAALAADDLLELPAAGMRHHVRVAAE